MDMTFETSTDAAPPYWDWQNLPDNLLLNIFSFLRARDVLRVSVTCRVWHRVAYDEFLWKSLFYRHWQIDKMITMTPGKTSWMAEYKRLYYHTPVIQSEVIKKHTDQVLHVSFAHNGTMFATCSKDSYIRVWNASYPVSLKYEENMKMLTYKYTQFSQFNESDTLLLVSGVHFGANSTSGEIAVFSLQGEFELQARVINKPYDVFGTWFNDTYLISGNLHWAGQLQSCSALWLNKASQETDSEHESVVMRLFRFHNVNASSIRTIMVARCTEELDDGASRENTPIDFSTASNSKDAANMIFEMSANSENHSTYSGKEDGISASKYRAMDNGTNQIKSSLASNDSRNVQSVKIYENGAFKTKLIQLDEDETGDKLNGTIEYEKDYRDAEGELQILTEAFMSTDVAMSASDQSIGGATCSSLNKEYSCINNGSNPTQCTFASSSCTNEFTQRDINETCDKCNSHVSKEPNHCGRSQDDSVLTSSNKSDSSVYDLDIEEDCVDACKNGMYLGGSVFGGPLQSNVFLSQNHMHANSDLNQASNGDDYDMTGPQDAPAYKARKEETINNIDFSNNQFSKNDESSTKCESRYLIFTMGSETYTPHQIGIKKICGLKKVNGSETRLRLPPDSGADNNQPQYDTIDFIIDMHGHIIGMCLSPDHRFLYVNSRPWPKNYKIENALYPPPIAQEIDIHVIDLTTMREVGTMHRSHKAYTPNDECFFIFLDVCKDYVASGAEDKHGYIWDRHYGMCLHKLPHNDVVNCVAFNPKDTETLVTISDDFTIKIWRSRNREKQVNMSL